MEIDRDGWEVIQNELIANVINFRSQMGNSRGFQSNGHFKIKRDSWTEQRIGFRPAEGSLFPNKRRDLKGKKFYNLLAIILPTDFLA